MELKPCWHCGVEGDELVLRQRTLTKPPFENEHKKIAFIECLPCDAEGIKAWEADKEIYGDEYDYIADAANNWNRRPIEDALNQRIVKLEEENKCIDTLRGQLQNAVNHLERAKRHWPSGGYDEAIARANKTLYETLNQ